MIPRDIEAVASLGWRVYPASRSSRAACFKGACHSATSDLNVISGWAREHPGCNWRVVCAGSGIWCLDIDAAGESHAADGISAMKGLLAGRQLPPRPMTRSGGGGYAMIWADTGVKLIGRSGTPLPGLDPLRGQQSLTIPPSVHLTTHRPYRWLTCPWDVAPPSAPDWLLDIMRQPEATSRKPSPVDTSDRARKAMFQACLIIVNAREGCRNDALNRQSWRLGKLIGEGLIGEQEAVEQLYGAARGAGLEHHDICATIKSGIRAGMR